MSTTKRRYPASLSNNPSGPSRPPRQSRSGRNRSKKTSAVPRKSPSVDDEVPARPELQAGHLPGTPIRGPPQELSSLEHLLQQAGYKETRVFTPEHEKVRRRLKTDLEEHASAELAQLYKHMTGNAPVNVRHLTHANIPLRSSSSVLRNIVLQDASTALNEGYHPQNPHMAPQEQWLASTLINQAAQAVGKNVSAMSPPSRAADSPMQAGLNLAWAGQGVRKVKSSFELGGTYMDERPQQEDIPPASRTLENSASHPALRNEVKEVPASKFAMTAPPEIQFSPPGEASIDQPFFEDDTFGYSPLPQDYEAQDDMDLYMENADDLGSISSLASSPTFRTRHSVSPPALFETQVPSAGSFSVNSDEELADPDEIKEAERHAAEIGQRILAATVQYDGWDSDDEDGYATPLPAPLQAPSIPVEVVRPTIPIIDIKAPTPPKPEQKAATEAAVAIVSPSKTPAMRLRAAASAPALSRPQVSTVSRRTPFRISPATIAPPALQSTAPILCDSVSNDAEDLPPIPPPPPSKQPLNTYGSLKLQARKSLSALRAAFWDEAVQKEEPSVDVDFAIRNGATPILTPRLDWSFSSQFAGWSAHKKDKVLRSERPSYTGDNSAVDSASKELADPFVEVGTGSIDYTKSFFYKPATPPRPPDGKGGPKSSTTNKVNKKRSVKSLRAALEIPIGVPPVPPIPDQYRRRASYNSLRAGAKTPPMRPPIIAIQSPGAWEEGRPPVPLVLEGDEWEPRSVANSSPLSVRRRKKGKRRAKPRSSDYDL